MDAERLRQVFKYERATGVLTWKAQDEPRPPNFNSRFAGKPAGCLNKHGYQVVRVDGVLLLAHRVIWCLVTGEEPKHEIDHKNGKPYDNRWTNLREATSSQQKCNRKVVGKLPRGVYKAKLQFGASIKVGGVKHYLGLFATAAEAGQAYTVAAERLHGQHAFHRSRA